MSIDPKFVELTAGVAKIILYNNNVPLGTTENERRSHASGRPMLHWNLKVTVGCSRSSRHFAAKPCRLSHPLNCRHFTLLAHLVSVVCTTITLSIEKKRHAFGD